MYTHRLNSVHLRVIKSQATDIEDQAKHVAQLEDKIEALTTKLTALAMEQKAQEKQHAALEDRFVTLVGRLSPDTNLCEIAQDFKQNVEYADECLDHVEKTMERVKYLEQCCLAIYEYVYKVPVPEGVSFPTPPTMPTSPPPQASATGQTSTPMSSPALPISHASSTHALYETPVSMPVQPTRSNAMDNPVGPQQQPTSESDDDSDAFKYYYSEDSEEREFRLQDEMEQYEMDCLDIENDGQSDNFSI